MTEPVRRVPAGEGDSFCSIAVREGFVNCQPLREEPQNAAIAGRQLQPGDEVVIPPLARREEAGPTEATHVMRREGVPLAAIRYVHGSPSDPPHRDPTLTPLNISNYVANRAGTADGSANWVNHGHTTYNADAHADPDTFKVEVHDTRTRQGRLRVTLEALRPTYDATTHRLTGHEQFPAGAQRNRRSLDVECVRVPSTNRFRSCYLRLVVDDEDKNARPRQTLLVTDMNAQGDWRMEILDQLVKATYVMPECPAASDDARCRVTTTAPVGTGKRRLRIAVHVFRSTVGGAGVVRKGQASRRVRTWMRRVYAQAGITPRVMRLRYVDPVQNLVSVSNNTGANAAGDGQLGFRINATGGLHQVIGPITPAAGATPQATAERLAALVTGGGFSARVSPNPPTFTAVQGSADLIITETSGRRVWIGNVVSGDSRQRLSVGRVNVANLESWDGTNWLVGSIQQRTALKNYDTGTNRVDILVVTQLTSGNRGEAMMSGHRVDPPKRAIDPVKWSAFVTAPTMDGTDNNPFTMPHEVGHVALELVHTVGTPQQMMTGTGTSGANAVDATKRIRDGNVTFDTPAGDYNQVSRLRGEGGPLLSRW